MYHDLNKVLNKALSVSKRDSIDISTAFFKLGEEFGELSEEFFKKFTFKGEMEDLQEETVDVMLCCIQILQKSGMSVERALEVAEKKIEKWEKNLER